MIGYKATDKNGCCRGFKYEVGKTYTKDTPKEKLECCTDKVFHFCGEIYAIEKTSEYNLAESRLFEVIAGDYVREGDKYGTNSLTILREIEGDEKLELINSGYRNSGHRNSGDWNSGNCNSGLFNSEENPKLKMFNKMSDWTINDWNNSDARHIMNTCPYTHSDFIDKSDMTDEEKENHPEYKTIGGFVKVFIVTKKEKEDWWNKLSDEDKDIIKSLPNFDFDIFRKCVGF